MSDQPKAQTEGGQPAVGNDEWLAWFDRHIEDESTHPFFAGSKSAKRSENAAAAFRLVREILAEELADAAFAVAGTAPSPVLYDELREAALLKARQTIGALRSAMLSGEPFSDQLKREVREALAAIRSSLPERSERPCSPAPIPKED